MPGQRAAPSAAAPARHKPARHKEAGFRALARGLLGPALLMAGALLGLGQPVLAQSNVRVTTSETASARHIDLPLGKSVMIELPRDAKEVFVANPAIANAVVRTARKVFLIASQVGQTNIFFTDDAGAQIAAIDINVERDVGPIRSAIRQALPDDDIKVEQLNEGVLLTGSAASVEQAAQAAAIAGRFLGKEDEVTNSIVIRGRDQVMLKVTVAEVQRQVLKQLGVNLSGSFEIGAAAVALAANNPFPLGNVLSGGNGYGTSYAGRSNSIAGSSTLQAFERSGVLHTLAEPTLTAISGESAHFLAGGEVPTPGPPSCDSLTKVCTISVEYKPIGVTLNFTPVVLDAGRISLRVATEVTDLDYENSISFGASSGGLSAPSFKTRKADTTVEIPSGGSIVMAGMLENSTRQVVNGTPGLMNVPVLGQLFRSRDYQRNESELMIVVTPYLAKPVDRKDLSLPTDGFADASDPQTWLLGRLNQVYGTPGSAPPNRTLHGRAGFILD